MNANLQRLPNLDGLRAIACLIVVASHFKNQLPFDFQGATGVLLFFCLSGFLMGHLYLSLPLDRANTKHFIIGRISRIAPVYYIACFIYIVLGMYFPAEYPVSVVNIVRLFTMTSSVGVLWSIGPEVQFYAFFVLLWFLFRRRPPVLMALTLIFIAACYVLSAKFPGILLPSKLHIFLMGMLASRLVAEPKLRNYLGHGLTQLGLLAASLAYFGTHTNAEALYQSLLAPALLALLIASSCHDTRVTAPLRLPALRMIGLTSFSIYLFHDPIHWILMGLAKQPDSFYAALVFVASVSLPLVFSLYIELPLSRTVRTMLTKAKPLNIKALAGLAGR